MQNSMPGDFPVNDTLKTSDLESYADFVRNQKNLDKRGVYIWGFRFFDPTIVKTSDFIPYYVGKHRKDIHQRIQEHVLELREGTHKIIRKELMLLNNRQEYFSSQKSVDHVYIHLRDTTPKNKLPIKEQLDLISHINFYVDNLYVSYIDVSHLKLTEDVEIKYIDYLERYIQKPLKYLCSRVGKKYPPSFKPVIEPGKGMENIFPKE